MDITEPDAGSDMAALRAVGEQDEHGNWFVTGQKIFITSGHGKYHFVIARTEKVENPDDPMSGLKGLSFFLVKTYDDLPDGIALRQDALDRRTEVARRVPRRDHHAHAPDGAADGIRLTASDHPPLTSWRSARPAEGATPRALKKPTRPKSRAAVVAEDGPADVAALQPRRGLVAFGARVVPDQGAPREPERGRVVLRARRHVDHGGADRGAHRVGADRESHRHRRAARSPARRPRADREGQA